MGILVPWYSTMPCFSLPLGLRVPTKMSSENGQVAMAIVTAGALLKIAVSELYSQKRKVVVAGFFSLAFH